MPQARKSPIPKPLPQDQGQDALPGYAAGDPVPQPEVVEHDSDQAWQDWLQAKARHDAKAGFEDTQPMEPYRPPAPPPG